MWWFESLTQMDAHFQPIWPVPWREPLRYPPPPRLSRRQPATAHVIIANPLDGARREYWLPRDNLPYLLHLLDVAHRATIRPRPPR